MSLLTSRNPRSHKFEKGARRTPANYVTMARAALSLPFLYWVRVEGAGWLVFTAGAVLAATDFLDGWLARREGATSAGAFLDPLADKLLTLGTFVALALISESTLSWLPVGIMAAREIGISIWRSIVIGRGVVIPARKSGKSKTLTQFLVLGVFLVPPFETASEFRNAAAWIAVGATIASGIDLIWHARRGAEPESIDVDS